MERFQFINEADLTSDKITSRRARKTIRAHVMRQHWATATGRSHQSVSKTAPKPLDVVRVHPSRSPGDPQVLLSDVVSSNETTESDYLSSNLSSDETSAQSDHPEDITELSWHLNRATDAFVYGGSYIDRKSFRFFSHYSSEFHVGLCSHIQPIPVNQTSICCATAVQENSSALLHAICYTGAVHEAAVRDTESDPRHLVSGVGSLSVAHQGAITHKAMALNQLNKHLMQHPSGITEATILCVTLLVVVEAIFSDITALSAHVNGLFQMIEMFGGEETLSPAIRTILHLADVKAATARRARPVYPLQPYLRRRFGSISATHVLDTDFDSHAFGTSFFSSLLVSLISPGLLECIPYTRHLVQVSEQYRSKRQNLSAYGIDDFVALEHRLLSLHSDVQLNKLSECSRLALLLYSNLALWKILPYFGWIPVLASSLKMALLALDGESQMHGPEVHQLLLWILFLGGQATAHDDVAGMTWWTSRLRLVIQELGLKEWNDAVRVLKGFFYVARVSETPWEKLWRAATSRDGGFVADGPLHGKHPCTYLH